MARVGENIYERKDGRFEGRLLVQKDDREGAGTKSRYVSVYGRSRDEVRRKLAALKEEMRLKTSGGTETEPVRNNVNEPNDISWKDLKMDPGSNSVNGSGNENDHRTDSSITSDFARVKGKSFREVAMMWLESKRGSIAATSFDRYTDALNRCVLPEYGDMPIENITDAEIERFGKSVVERTKRDGRNVTMNILQMSVGVLTSVVNYARNSFTYDSIDIAPKEGSYEALDATDIERVCFIARHNETPEMLAALLTMYTGIRMGEICALEWKDVSFERCEIFIHQSVHRVRTEEEEIIRGRVIRTALKIEEIPTRKHIRTVTYPEILNDYIRKFYKEGVFVLTGRKDAPADARTVQNRIKRILEEYQLEDINFQRLHKTYARGCADTEILNNVFLGVDPARPYKGMLDKDWLKDEMVIDAKPLRLLLGLSDKDMAKLMGLPLNIYNSIENGRREMEWREYLTLLFIYSYNKRTEPIVDTLGLFPEALRTELSLRGD